MALVNSKGRSCWNVSGFKEGSEKVVENNPYPARKMALDLVGGGLGGGYLACCPPHPERSGHPG